MLRSVKLRQKKHPRPAETSRRSLGDERARPWYHPALPPADKNPSCAACGLYQVRKPYPAPFTERVRRSLRRKKPVPDGRCAAQKTMFRTMRAMLPFQLPKALCCYPDAAKNAYSSFSSPFSAVFDCVGQYTPFPTKSQAYLCTKNAGFPGNFRQPRAFP